MVENLGDLHGQRMTRLNRSQETNRGTKQNPIITLKDTISFVPSFTKTLEKKKIVYETTRVKLVKLLKQIFVGKRKPKKKVKVRSVIKRRWDERAGITWQIFQMKGDTWFESTSLS